MKTINSLENKTNLLDETKRSPSNSCLKSNITPIHLNLYDLGGCINICFHSVGLAFYHCAVQVHITEYGYMGHPYKFTGLYKTSKHDSRFHLYRLRDSIQVGWTSLNENEIDRIVDELRPYFIGCDYDTVTNNSINFAKYLLEKISNDFVLKYINSKQIIDFPAYVNGARRLCQNIKFLQIFDKEKDIAEMNILFFLYMKYNGDVKQICRTLECDTIDKLKRFLFLIEQGIEMRKLPLSTKFNEFDLINAKKYLYVVDKNCSNILPMNEQLTLTDIFHQFDTITLRGRTSIDRYLNTEQNNEFIQNFDTSCIVDIPQMSARITRDRFPNEDPKIQLMEKYHSFSAGYPEQYRTTLISSQDSTSANLPMKTYEHLIRPTVVPIGTIARVQDKTNPKLPLTELHLTTGNEQRRNISSSRKRKLPRDIELSSSLYTISNRNSIRSNFTNNATSSSTVYRSSKANQNLTENIDSNV